MLRAGRIFAGLVLAGALVTCDGATTTRREGVVRLVDRDPQELYDPGALFVEAPVFAWRFEGANSFAGWKPLQPEPFGIEDALVLTSRGTSLRFEREVELEASEIDAIEVETEGLMGASLAILWAGPGEELSPERRITLTGIRDPRGKAVVHRFALSSEPRWTGAIRKLRFSIGAPESLPGYVIRVFGIRGIRQDLDAARLAEAAARTWKVDLGSEVRDAWLGIPGSPIEREVDVPPDARIELALGVPGNRPEALRFRVQAQTGDTEPRTLLDEVVAEGSPADEGWLEREIPLDDFAGERIRLRFETEGAGSADPRSLAAWGTPWIRSGSSRRQRPNVVLVSIDTLRADHLSLYGYGRPTSPNLDAWAQGAAVFESVVAPAPSTLPSHVAMLSGLDPLRHGVNHWSAAPATIQTLAERLRAEGYRTLAITGGSFVHPRFGLAQGFEVFRYWRNRSKDERELEVGLAGALDWLERYRGEPLFLFFHTYEVHSPYLPRQPFLRRLTGRSDGEPVIEVLEEPDPSDGYATRFRWARMIEGRYVVADDLQALGTDLYDSGIAYADDRLASLFRELDAGGARGDTLVVITSDHGEMLGERGLFSHAYLEDENLRVPLVVRAPGGRWAGRRIRETVGVVDVTPTVLDLVGLATADDLDGRSVRPLLEGQGEPRTDGIWSYAAGTNHGISLRLGNRWSYRYDNTAWEPRPPHDRAVRGGDPDRDARLEVEAREALRRRVRERYAASPGLRIELHNGGTGSLVGHLRGRPVSLTNVKSADLECPCVRYLREGSARLEVPPGTTYSLTVEDPGAEPVTLGLVPLSGAEGRQLREELRFAAGSPPRTFVLGPGGWNEQGSERPSGAEVWARVTFQGAGAGERAPHESDESLREDLKALGYLR